MNNGIARDARIFSAYAALGEFFSEEEFLCVSDDNKNQLC